MLIVKEFIPFELKFQYTLYRPFAGCPILLAFFSRRDGIPLSSGRSGSRPRIGCLLRVDCSRPFRKERGMDEAADIAGFS